MKITGVRVRDIRFPTSRNLDGSDALNVGDYSATYVIVETDGGASGHGLTFTNGRGNELTVAAVHALRHHVIGLTLEEVKADMRGLYRKLTVDPQLRWLGPEKGILHMATGALLNAVWDLWAKAERKPLWKLLVDLTPEQLVSTVDFSYLSDALTVEQALELLRKQQPTRAAREAEMRAQGYPAYTTSTGWLGYSDEKVRRLCEEAVAAGWTHLKMKVGQDLEMNRRRAGLIRSIIGPKGKLMMDANQCWDVPEAIRQMHSLAEFDPWWIEEPTSPDDVLGHAAIAREVAPIRVATGEACQNRVIFKQLLQAGAIGFCQVDSCRVGGVNEVLSIMLLATRFARVAQHRRGGRGGDPSGGLADPSYPRVPSAGPNCRTSAFHRWSLRLRPRHWGSPCGGRSSAGNGCRPRRDTGHTKSGSYSRRLHPDRSCRLRVSKTRGTRSHSDARPAGRPLGTQTVSLGAS